MARGENTEEARAGAILIGRLVAAYLPDDAEVETEEEDDELPWR